jgi:hypothetical protein
MDEKDASPRGAADDPMSDRRPLVLPDWLPPSVADRARKIEITAHTDEQLAILARMATDGRMRSVWRELTRRERKTGAFFHPAKARPDLNFTSPDQIQAQALDELFFFVFSAARDRMSTSTPDQVEAVRRGTMVRVKILRECASFLRQKCVDQPQAIADAEAVDRVANWFQGLATGVRSSSDPLTVRRERGDPIVRGVSAIIGVWLSERFGKRLDGIAAKLASVALGKPAKARAVRSALRRTKGAVKAES